MSASGWHLSSSEVAAKLDDERLFYALRHGSMKVGLYAPHGQDEQSPHKQDELYIVSAGSGSFIKAGERVSFGPQDVLFVEAGVEHHFEDLSDDFAVWVIFWGSEGGEAA